MIFFRRHLQLSVRLASVFWAWSISAYSLSVVSFSHQGRIAEMRTGEGKTLVATLPSYLNALEGKGVHIVTVNDYLAKRDADEMGQIHRFLGLNSRRCTE